MRYWKKLLRPRGSEKATEFVAWEILGTEHLGGIIKGVNFGGIKDKQYTRMPNEGNRCAYPKCPQNGFVGEGMAARFAHNDPTLWCHKACADRWEVEEPGLNKTAPAVVEDKPKCGAPHPELHEYRCANDEGHGHYHNSGAGHSWYMEPAQVATLKAAVEAKYGKLDAPPVLSDPGSEPLDPAMVADAVADYETAVQDAVAETAENQGTMNDPEPLTEENILSSPSQRPSVGLTSSNNPSADIGGDSKESDRAKGIKRQLAAGQSQGNGALEEVLAAAEIGATNLSYHGMPDQTIADVLAVTRILRLHQQTEPDPLLVGALIAWKRS